MGEPRVFYAADKCSQPAKETGPCADYVLLYSYVSSSGHCEEFYYGGCEGSDNRFESSEDCEAECMRERTTRRPAATTQRPTERPDHQHGQTTLPTGQSSFALLFFFTHGQCGVTAERQASSVSVF